MIDDIKAEHEKECRGLVSCAADVLALATRNGVALSGGAAYALPTAYWEEGRDGVNDAGCTSPRPFLQCSGCISCFPVHQSRFG